MKMIRTNCPIIHRFWKLLLNLEQTLVKRKWNQSRREITSWARVTVNPRGSARFLRYTPSNCVDNLGAEVHRECHFVQVKAAT